MPLRPSLLCAPITADSLEVFAQPTRCRQLKVFLFSMNKRETPGMYKVLSTTFRKDALFALVCVLPCSYVPSAVRALSRSLVHEREKKVVV
ncbi:unnamed protein product [Closterium sp. Yama58-4]|nr:unnamed protein product [Closterium sp. Yama58-4]